MDGGRSAAGAPSIPARRRGAERAPGGGRQARRAAAGRVITFLDDATGRPKRAIVQVKSGHVRSGDIRDLKGTVAREDAALGLFLTLEEPSADMATEAVTAGYYHAPGWGRDYPRIQILTIAQLLAGTEVNMPPAVGTFRVAQKIAPPPAAQGALALE